MNPSVSAALRGAVAGAVATLPMSAVMYAARQVGLMGEYPPEIITEHALDAAGVTHGEDANDALATLAHLGFGATAGAVFGIAHDRLELPVAAPVQGMVYGLVVYALSYSGWIPALHIMPEPDDDRPGRQPSMVAAHLIYGATLGRLLSFPAGRSWRLARRAAASALPAE